MRIAMVMMFVSGLPFMNCLPDGPVLCSTQFVYGVNVAVTDATTGDPIDGATLTLTEGDYVEVMEELASGSHIGAGERSGTYSLVAEAEGFETVTMDRIVVAADECHVISVSLAIEMDPL